LLPQNGNASITTINCGSSFSRLGGVVDVSAFLNLTNFTCNNNNITEISGYSNNSNLITLSFVDNLLTESLPSLSGMTNLQEFKYNRNQISGSIPPSLSDLAALRIFQGFNNAHTGSIPSLSSLVNLRIFQCDLNNLTGTIPALNANTELTSFSCNSQRGATKLTGSIPSLAGLTNLLNFYCYNNQLSDFAGGSVSNKLGDFKAQNNLLPASAVDAILSAFVTANKTTGTRILSLHGNGNASPTSVGVIKTTLSGTAFSRSDTTVTVNSTAHGYVTGDYVTVKDIAETDFQGTFAITRINDNTFQYTTLTTGALTGSGTATLRKTSTGNTSGFRSYQNLALVSRTGGPWDININFPA
jgi:hypothetical protein